MQFQLKKFQEAIAVTRLANIHYFEFTNRYHTEQDRHPFREMVYVDSGRITVESESFSGELGKNCLIIHKAGELHSLSCAEEDAPNVIIIGFECGSARLDAFSERAMLLNEECQSLLVDVIKEGRKVFLPPYDIPNTKNMKKRTNYPFGADQMIRLKLEAFLIELIRSAAVVHSASHAVSADAKSNDVYLYLLENFREKINLDELCFLYGTNKTSLCANFKNHYGDSIISFLNRLRVTEAKRLMREGKMNLSEIALNVGFSSLHYFSRIFKQYEEKAPSEYIRTIKAKLGM